MAALLELHMASILLADFERRGKLKSSNPQPVIHETQPKEGYQNIGTVNWNDSAEATTHRGIATDTSGRRSINFVIATGI